MQGFSPNASTPNAWVGRAGSTVVPPGSGPGSGTPGPITPTSADIYAYTIMRVSTINLRARLGPSAINLTASLL